MGAARKAPIPFPLPDDLTGRKVGRFVVHSRLGAGGMGEVWYAEDTTLERPVALKRLAHRVGSDPEARRRIVREAHRASGLTSEHIAAIHDVVEADGEFFLVMEYVEGTTLRAHLRQPMTLEQFFEIATQCVEAIAAAHRQAIVHCDIKPENIMLTPQGRVKILDFGLAKHLPHSDQSSTLERTGLFGGTPAYMAPEILREQLPDSRTDIFSLGVVFYEMLTGRHPFSASTPLATGERILHDTPAPIRALNPGVSGTLEAIVLKAMAKIPGHRYADAGELLRQLRGAQAGTRWSKSGLLTRLQLAHSARGWLMAALVVIAAVAVVSTRAWWIRRNPVMPERGWAFVADFDVSGEDVIPATAAREGLTIALQQSRYINVFPRSRAYEVLQRMRKANVSRIDELLGREICQRENLQVLLTGNIERSGHEYQMTVRGIDPIRSNLLFTEFERFEREEQFFEKADQLAKKIRNDLGESLDRIETTSRPLAKVTTTSLAALQLYSRAKNAQYGGTEEPVESLLKGALQLDPDFAMAHLWLGQYYSAVVGKNERALAEVERAYLLRQDVTEWERHRIEAQFYDLQERYEEKAETLRLLVELYPDDEEAHRELAAAYYDLGQLDAAISEVREALRLNPFSAPAYGSLVLYLARDNRADDAIAAGLEGMQRGIGSPRMHWGMGLAYLAKGDVSEARKEFERIGRATATDRDLQELCAVVVELYEGRLGSAQAKLIEQIQEAPPQNGGLRLFRQYLLGRTYLAQGDVHNAELQADFIAQAPASHSQGGDLLNAGILYVRVRKLSKARVALSRLDELQRTTPSSSNQSNFRNLQGEIRLAEGLPEQAETSFVHSSSGFSLFDSSMGLARTYQFQARWSQTAEQWNNVLGEQGQILQSGFPVDLANAHLELARTYRQLNERDLARKQYLDVIRMWQHADQLKSLREAKEEFRDLATEASSPTPHKALPARS